MLTIYLAIAGVVTTLAWWDTKYWKIHTRAIQSIVFGLLWPLVLFILVLGSISGPKHYKIKNSIDIDQE